MLWYVLNANDQYPQYLMQSAPNTKIRDLTLTFRVEDAVTFPTQIAAEEAAAWCQLLNHRCSSVNPLVVRSDKELIERILTKDESAQ